MQPGYFDQPEGTLSQVHRTLFIQAIYGPIRPAPSSEHRGQDQPLIRNIADAIMDETRNFADTLMPDQQVDLFLE